MKTKKVDNNPIVRQDDLTKVKDSISNYLKGNYPKYLNQHIKDIIENEIIKNLEIKISGYSTIDVTILYKGHVISKASKYHPRG